MKRVRSIREDGASLILLLIFILVISVLALATLGLASASFSGTEAARTSRQNDYAADAALQLALKRVATDATGLLGTADGPSCSFTFRGLGPNGSDAVVSCAPNGSAGSIPGTRLTYALLSLSSTRSLDVQGTHTLGVVGDVHANNVITTDSSSGSTLDVTGTVGTSVAGGDCNSGRVTATTKVCGTSPTVNGSTLAWATQKIASTTAGSVTCTTGPSPGKVVTALFSPGTYTTAPSAMVSALKTPNCNPDVWLFADGTYDFKSVAIQPGSATVVAGSPSPTWWNATTSQATSMPTGDGVCANATSTTQLILEGTARINLASNGSVKPGFSVCAGMKSNGDPNIAIFGSSLTSSDSAPAMQSDKDQNLFVHGIVYLPTANVSLNLHNKSETLLDGGVVVSYGIFTVSASSKQIDSPISLAPCTSADPCRSDRSVDFTSSVASNAWIKSRVDFDDGGGSHPGQSYVVKTWSILR